MYNRVETGSGDPGYPGELGNFLSRSSRSDLTYEISGYDPDSVLHQSAVILASSPDKIMN